MIDIHVVVDIVENVENGDDSKREDVIGRDIRVERREGPLKIDVVDIFSSLTFMLLLTLLRMVMILSEKK